MPAARFFIGKVHYAPGNYPDPDELYMPSDQSDTYEYNPLLVDDHTFYFTVQGAAGGTDPHYKFLNWSGYQPGATVEVYCSTASPSNTVTLTANWQVAKQFRVDIYCYQEDGTYTIQTDWVYLFPGETTTVNITKTVTSKAYYTGYWTENGKEVTSVSVTYNAQYAVFYKYVYANYRKKNRSLVYNKNLEGYTVSNVPSKETWWCYNAHTISSTIPTTNKVNGINKIFFKWNTKANGTGTYYDPTDSNANTIPRADTSSTVNLYAIWKYNFIYKPDSNSNETSNAVSRVEPGKSLKIASKFTHKADAAYDWEIDYYTAGSTKYYVGTSYTLTGDVEATVHWKKKEKEYAVKYNANTSDSSVNGIPDTQYKKHTSNLTLSSSQPTRTGYNFVNWNTKANGSGTTYNPGDIYSTNEAVTLYAQWERKNITITYKLNGGSGTLPGNNGEVIIEHGWGTNITLDTSYYLNLTKKYHKCLGWNTNKNASSPIATLTNVTANTDVFATWKEKTLKVRYESDGVIVSDGNRYQGTEYVTKDDNDSAISGFRREGASLFGWAKEENSPTRYCALGEKIILPNQSDNSTFTLYPYWRNTFDAYYCKHITTTRGQRIIYQEDYIKKGGF